MQTLQVNWKTTLLGIGTIGVSLFGALVALVDGDPATTVNVEVTVAQIMLGLGMITARDADKSSQDSGVRP